MNSWYFASTGKGQEDGFNDPILEFFQGDYDKFLARETVQNSLDARVSYDEPVTVRFVYFELDPSELPGLPELQSIIAKAKDYATNQPRPYKFYTSAQSLIQRRISCLRISDYNTTGLRGSDDEREGSWHKLTKAQGVNNLANQGGGSFGIGKGAPFVASGLRTVFYSTYNRDGEYIFQGVSRLSSFEDDDSDVRRGIGSYGSNNEDGVGVASIRNPDDIPAKFRRNPSAGTGSDINVIGYRTLGDWKRSLIASVLNNFWIAVYHGDLRVELIDSKGLSVISKDTLSELVEEYSGVDGVDLQGYYLALDQPTFEFHENLPLLGRSHFYIKRGEGLSNKIQMTRSPKMVVQTKRINMPEEYLGVFICDDEKGNLVLRELEPASHDKWDRSRIYEGEGSEKIYGAAALKSINNWVKEKLESISRSDPHTIEEIPDLGKYLPAEEESIRQNDSLAERGFDPNTKIDDPPESARIRKPVVRTPAPVVPTLTGRPTGTIKTPGASSKSKAGMGSEENEDSEVKRIALRSGDIRSREIKAGGDRRYVVKIRSDTDQNGNIRIVVYGENGSMFDAPLAEACYFKSREAIQTKDSMLLNVEVNAGNDNIIEVKLNDQRRYSVGVEAYE